MMNIILDQKPEPSIIVDSSLGHATHVFMREEVAAWGQDYIISQPQHFTDEHIHVPWNEISELGGQHIMYAYYFKFAGMESRLVESITHEEKSGRECSNPLYEWPQPPVLVNKPLRSSQAG